jgi:hypothetical protein
MSSLRVAGEYKIIYFTWHIYDAYYSCQVNFQAMHGSGEQAPVYHVEYTGSVPG